MMPFWEEQALRAAIGERSAYTLTAEDVLESLNDAFCALSKDLRLVAANTKALALWKATDQVVGQTLVMAFPELSGSELAEAFALTAADGQSRCIEATWPHSCTPLHVDIRASGPSVHVYFRDVARYRDMQTELRRSHETLTLAEHCAGIGVWDADLLTQTFRGTEQFFRIMGLQPVTEAVPIEVTRRLRPSEDQAKLMQGFEQAVESGADFYEGEYRIIRPDGQMRWIYGRGRVIRDDAGVPVRYSGIDIDVTERKASETALRESEERFRHVFEQSPLGIATAGPDFRFRSVNPALCRMLDYAEAELGGMSFLDLVHPDDRANCLAMGRALIEGELSQLQLEERFVRKSGEPFWVSVNVSAIRDEEGRVLYSVGVIEDIDERRRTQQALHESERRLRELNEKLEQQAKERARQLASSRAQLQAFFDNSPDWLTLQRITPDGTSVYVDLNPTAEIAYGFRREQVVGRRLEEILGEDAAQLPLHHLRECLRTGQPQRYVARRTMAGRTRTIDVMFVLVPGEGSDGGRFIITTARDITEREELEAQLRQSQKMEAIGQLTGGIAHDFNNLLTPIYGALDILQRRFAPEERPARMISGALQSAERARVLVGRLLSFARRQHLEARPVAVPELVRGMTELIDRSLGPLIEVKLDMAPALPMARVDPNQLELALLNLCVNARDAMPGGGTLRIAAEEIEATRTNPFGLAPGQYVRLSVTDTGTGMDAETLRRAIEPFYTTKGVGRGTGLGLSMVHGLAAQSGGALTLESAPGQGTTAILYLPVADTEAAATFNEVANWQPIQIRQLTILLVDDEELVRMGLADMLEGMGHRVVQAASGAEALQQLRSVPEIELVITDYMMPSMTGAALVREARRLRPGLPALLVTGYANLDAATVDHLPRIGKPFRESDLIAAMVSAMGEGKIVPMSWAAPRERDI